MERLPWHDALYFVTTTLTTVGYGDVVVKSPLGKLAVLVMMAVGVVLIPVRTSQLYKQVASQRITAGAPVWRAARVWAGAGAAQTGCIRLLQCGGGYHAVVLRPT